MNIEEKRKYIAHAIENISTKYSQSSFEVIKDRLQAFGSGFFEELEYEIKIDFQNRFKINSLKSNDLLRDAFGELQQFSYKFAQKKNVNEDIVTEIERSIWELNRLADQISHQNRGTSRHSSYEENNAEFARALRPVTGRLEQVKNELNQRGSNKSEIYSEYTAFMNEKLLKYSALVEQKEKECIAAADDVVTAAANAAAATVTDGAYDAIYEERNDDILSILSKNSLLDSDYNFANNWSEAEPKKKE